MRVLIQAYVKGNLGDDLFIRILCDRYPKTKFYVVGLSKFNFFKELKNIRYISHDKLITKILSKGLQLFLRITRKLFLDRGHCINLFLKWTTDFTVIIGGSMFIQTKDWKRRYVGDKTLINKRTLILGCNFGPYNNIEYYNAYKLLFSKAYDISFRDKHSYELFKDIDNVRINPDIVFNLIGRDYTTQCEDYYIISVISIDEREELSQYSLTYYDTMAQIANRLSLNGHKIILMSFCDSQNDIGAAHKILEKANNRKISIHSHNNIKDSLDIIRKSKGIIATRFHAMILAFVYKLPVFPVIYSDKMEHVIEDLGFTGHYCKINEFNFDIIEKVIESMNSEYEIRNINLAFSNFSKLDEVLI